MNRVWSIIGCLGMVIAGAGSSRAEVLQLAAGARQSLALVTGGDVLQWGEWGGPLPVSVFGVDRVKAIAAGAHHMLALRPDGSVWAWGDNSSGQLGNGTVINADRPARVMDITGAIAIAAAGNQSYALKNDGTVWAWGANASGQLGDGTTHDRRGPVVVEGLIDATAIAAGESAFMALRKDGGVCYLGIAGSATLVCNSSFHSVAAVAAEARSGYVLLRDGTVHSLGGGSCVPDITHDDFILDDVRAITAGASHLLLLREDGTVWSCGKNTSGQLGNSATDPRDRPVQAGGSLVGVTQIAAGGAHSLAVNDGGVWSWGDNTAGQLGTGNTTARPQPGPIWDGTGRLR